MTNNNITTIQLNNRNFEVFLDIESLLNTIEDVDSLKMPICVEIKKCTNNTSKTDDVNNVFVNAKKVYIKNNNSTILHIENKGHLHILVNNQDNFNNFSFYVNFASNENDCYNERYFKQIQFNYEVIKNSNKKAYSKSLSLNTDRSSFLMMRTNPKLTGNIKLVVDSNQKIYLDTFDVNTTLSNKMYKHKEVSNLSNYANDIRNIFSRISKKELFDVPHNNIFDYKTNLYEQFVDIYSYGVSNNTNKLYPENFSMLAPLYLNNELPDFFVIFKLDGATNTNISSYTPTERLKYFIKNGVVVKSFDLRKNTSIGSYLRNIVNENEKYNTSIYISLNDKIPNQWNGISIDRGILTNINESGYLLSQVKNQVDYDRFITNGFERNGIINSHLINLEFLFDDETSEDFSINRYFGLYVSNTSLNKIQFMDEDTILLKEENKEISFEDFIKMYNIKSDNEDFIFNITNAKNDFIRIKDVEDLKNYYKNSLKGITFNNTISTNSSQEYISYKDNNMLLFINEPLKPGEHLRILDKDNHKVYEVILGKIDTNKYNNLSDYYESENYPILNYSQNIEIIRNIAPGCNIEKDALLFDIEENKDNIIKVQIEYIVKSFSSILSSEEFVITNNSNSIFISSSNNNLTFERISGQIIYDDDEEFVDIQDELYNSVTYFGLEIPNIILKPSLVDTYSDNYIFQPINFEVWNNRIAYIVDFLHYTQDEIYNIPIEEGKKINDNSFICTTTDNGDIEKNKLSDFILTYYADDSASKAEIRTALLLSNKSNNYIIKSSNNNLNVVNIFESSNFDINVAGILPIKDFNFNVLDNSFSFYHLNDFQKMEEKDEYNEEYKIENNDAFTIKKLREEGCENFINYISILKDSSVDTTIFDELYNESKRKMDIPLVTPINCKWKLYGKDIFNDKIKSTLFFDNIKDASSYRLNIDNKNNIFGFLSDSDKDKKLYIENNILNYIEDGDTIESMRNYILHNGGNIYQFVNDPNKFVKCFYNYHNNSLDVIFYGQKIQISSSKISFAEFDDYLFTLVCVPNFIINTNNVELLFDKENKVILGLWYLGVKDVTLSGRNDNNITNDSSSNYISNFIKLNANVSLNNLFNNRKLPITLNDSNLSKIDRSKLFLSAINLNDNYDYNNRNYTFEFKTNVIDNGQNVTYEPFEIRYDESIDTSIYTNMYYTEGIEQNIIKETATFFNTNNKVDCYITNDKIETLKEIGRATNIFNLNSFKNTSANGVDMHIISKDKTITYKNGITFNFIEPNKISNNYYTYNGYIQPEFINIVEFNNNDIIKVKNDIKEKSSKDKDILLYFNNLTISKVNNIGQIWYNKIFNTVLDNGIEKYKKFSLDYISDIDITRTCWEDKFYTRYNNDNITFVNGYEVGKDTKTFFGSHALVLKTNEIIITDWNDNYTEEEDIKDYNEYDDNKNKRVIKLNVTNALLNYITSKTNIKNNWTFKQESSSFGESYIKKLIETFYSINNKNIIKVYSRLKTSDDTITKYTNDGNFIEVKNINTSLSKEKDDYILKLSLPIDNNEYAIKYTIQK